MADRYDISKLGNVRTVRNDGELIGTLRLDSPASRIKPLSLWRAVRADGSTVRLDADSTQPMIGTLRFWRSPSAWK